MAKKIIIVTGTPGTGKTTLAKSLAQKLGFDYLDLKEVILEHHLDEGFDKERDCVIVDVNKLSPIVIDIIKSNENGLVIDSHLSHFLPKEYVDVAIVCKCELKELKRRLDERGYHEEKVRENLDAEIFDICLNEAKEAGYEVLVYDCKNPDYKTVRL